MSILNRPLTERELAIVESEPAAIAHETFTQVFAVDRGELEILDVEDDETPPAPTRIGLAAWAWAISSGAAIGTLIYAAAVTS